MVKRKYLPDNLQLLSFDSVKPYYEQLLNSHPLSSEDCITWLQQRSELEAFVSEQIAWSYIKFTCNTSDTHARERYEFLITEVQPHLTSYEDKLNRHFLQFNALDELEKEKKYFILIRDLRNQVELFREKNVPLFTELRKLSKQYAELNGSLTIRFQEKELTMQQAAAYLENPDRNIRKEVYDRMVEARMKVSEQVDELFSQMWDLRQEVASNAGFSNYRDYKFQELGRFDFSIEQNLEFHQSIKQALPSVMKQFLQWQKEMLGLDELRPYDLQAVAPGKQPLKPFQTAGELVDKAIIIFDRLGKLGHYLKKMKERGFMDLENRKGKAPGGYNYPLSETGIPFIFMNATGRFRDMVTLMHEGGHAVHSFLTRDLPLIWFRHTPSEVAELASMSMELLTMDYWDEFFDSNDLKRARLKQLEDALSVLVWVARVDKFQHEVYLQKENRIHQFCQIWENINREYETGMVNYSGYEEAQRKLWHQQLHIFEVPFYYIEYAIAQLGALSVWKNFKEKGSVALEQYLDALAAGYTLTVPEIYQKAGIEFDFSLNHLQSLMSFVLEEMNNIKKA